MLSSFPKGSLDHVSHCIDSILVQGAKVLYDHYLMEKLPEHATANNVQIVRQIMDPETKLARKAQPIKGDSQPVKITKDNLAMKTAHIQRMPVTIKLEPKQSLTPSKTPMRKKYSSVSNRLSNLLQPRQSTRQNASTLQVVKLDQPPLTEEALKSVRLEDELRKRKQEQQHYEKEERQKENELVEEHQQRLKKLTHEFQEIQKKHYRYTYDFDGKILQCGPVNAKTQLFSKSLYPEIRVKWDDERKDATKSPKKKSTISSNQRTTTSKSEMFNSVVFNSVTGSKLTKALRGNSLGSDFVRNETYNNNNKRQMSNLNLIDLHEGTKLTEVDNHCVMTSERKEPVTRGRFVETLAKLRFRSFFRNNQDNVEEQDEYERVQTPGEEYDKKPDSRAATTKMPSSMSGRTKRYTLREKETSILGADRKPMTADDSVRRKSESLRPKTSTREAWGRVHANEQMLELLFE